MTDLNWIVLLALGIGSAVGVMIGVVWERQDWVRAAFSRKLIRYDHRSGKLIWSIDKGEVP